MSSVFTKYRYIYDTIVKLISSSYVFGFHANIWASDCHKNKVITSTNHNYGKSDIAFIYIDPSENRSKPQRLMLQGFVWHEHVSLSSSRLKITLTTGKPLYKWVGMLYIWKNDKKMYSNNE